MNKQLLAALARIERKRNPAVEQAAARKKREGVPQNRAELNGNTLRLYGIVGDWWDGFTDDTVADLLDDYEEEDLQVRVNSPGGYVYMGMAIYQLLKEREAVFTVDGLAASIASVIIMAGHVRVHHGSQIMIHNPWNIALGDSDDLRREADILDKVKDSIISVYEKKTGHDRELLAEMMDQETWLNAEEAIEWGFADELIDADEDDDDVDPEAAIARLDLSILRDHVPEQIAAMSRTAPPTNSTEDSDMPPKDKVTASGKETPDTKDTKDTQAQIKKAGAEARAAEKQRQTDIRKACKTAKLDDDFAQDLIDKDVTVEDAREAIINKWAEGGAPDISAPNGSITVTRDERDTRVTAISKAIMHRYAPAQHNITDDDPARQYAGMTLMDIARAVCQANSIDVTGMPRTKIAQNALSTSDFPLITENVLGKMLRAGYELAPRTFVPLGRQSTLPDFKEVSRVQLGEAPKLAPVLEGGEYTAGEIGEAAEKYRLFKYGKLVPITWETLVNDDLDAFTRIPSMMGAQAAQLESDLFWAHFTGNPTMHDGNALFSATHGNLASPGTVIDIDTISAGRAAMRKQTGLDGETLINVQAKYLVVPATLETRAEQFVSQNMMAEEAARINVFAGRLEVVSEPRLDINSEAAWYLWSDPGLVDTIEYAYLEGEAGPMVEIKEGFHVDGVITKIRHVFGVKAIDWRGLYQNPGP